MKLPLYAGAKIAGIWPVDLGARTVEVCAGPRHNAYEAVAAARSGWSLAPRTVPGLSLATDDILG